MLHIKNCYSILNRKMAGDLKKKQYQHNIKKTYKLNKLDGFNRHKKHFYILN